MENNKNNIIGCLGCFGIVMFLFSLAYPPLFLVLSIILFTIYFMVKKDKNEANINNKNEQPVEKEPLKHTEIPITPEFRPIEPIKRKIFDYKTVDTFKSDYVVLDVETTGLDHYDCDIIQISILAYINHKLVDKYVSYVRPVYDELTPKITRLTGIKQSDLDDAPTFKEIADSVYNLINNQLIIAHNAKFDMGFICESFKRYGFDKNVELTAFDTWKASRRYIKGLPNYKLETLKKHFKIDVKSHDAYNDCLVTQKVYEHIYHLVSAEYSYDDFQIETHKRIARIINKKQLYVFKHKTKGDYAIGVFYTALKYRW